MIRKMLRWLNMDEQRRRQRKARERKRKRKQRRRRVFQIEMAALVLIFAVLCTVAVMEYSGNREGQKNSLNAEDSVPDRRENGQQADVQNPERAGGQDGESQQDKDGLEQQPEEEKDNVPEDAIVLENDGTGEVVLAFGGDICFHDEYSNMYSYRQKGSDIANCISADLLGEMRGADIFMVNNEFTYTTRGEPIEGKAFTFRSNPENVGILADMGADIVSLANNHAYDYGEISLLDTLDTLRAADIPYVGAGRNLAEASDYVVFSKNGISISFLSATQIERLDSPDTRGATAESAGVFRCWGNKINDLTEAVAKAKQESDYVVVYIHWGTENTDELDWAQTEQAKLIAEAGADLIVGDHSHCLQQFANVGGVPVIYSLGNFWFNSKTLDTGLLKITLSRDGISSYQFLPAIQQNCTTSLVSGAEKERILAYMREISVGVTIDADGYVTFDTED